MCLKVFKAATLLGLMMPGVPIDLSKAVELVDEARSVWATYVWPEDWEIARHQHVHLHRKAFQVSQCLVRVVGDSCISSSHREAGAGAQ